MTIENVRPSQTVFGGSRPCTINLPNYWSPRKTYPLLVGFHALGAGSPSLDLPNRFRWNVGGGGFQLENFDDGVISIYPVGTVDNEARNFWNASANCCNFDPQSVDDVTYITNLIAEIRGVYHIDANRIFLAGYSNGAFMALRMACEIPTVICAVAALSGCNPTLDSSCFKGTQHVSVVQIHGDADGTVTYAGDPTGVINTDVPVGAWPGAVLTANNWGAYNGGGSLAAAYDSIDFDAGIAGSETARQACTGTPADGAVEHWKVAGQGHVPNWQTRSGQRVWAWLMSHPGIGRT
jgi:polyhydroxybutyrate depolymerase